MSDDPEQVYFSDGLSDTLIHVLAQVSGLKVTAKTSSFYFKGRDVTISEIAEKLQVAHVLEGSVQKSGDRIRVIAQLINADDGNHLWSKTFDRDLTDIFAVQDEIAQEIVKSLEVTLLDTEEERLAQRYRPTLEAYEQLIQGRQEKAKRTAEGLAAAEQHFKQAIELDPDYALAYVGLADTYYLQVMYADLTREESLQRRLPLVDKALELNPLSGEVYTSRGALFRQLREPEAAEESFLRAIELNPNYATAHHWYYVLLGGQARFEEALAQIRTAAELDPMAPIIQLAVAISTWDAGRAEEALTLLRRNIQQNPEFPNNYWYIGDYQLALGHLGVAQRWYPEALKRNPEAPQVWRDVCHGFLNLGDELLAEDCVNQLGETHPEKSDEVRYTLHLYRGEWDAAISNGESILERWPGSRRSTSRLADLIARQGNVKRARRLMTEVFPKYLEDGLELTAIDLPAALVFVSILHANGEMQRRDVLLLAMEQRIDMMHRIRGYGYGTLDVYIHVMRGERDRAIAGLREAIDMGWRASINLRMGSWWMLRQDWKLGSLRQDPEFIAMMNELGADIRKQRQWFEENKDKPLF